MAELSAKAQTIPALEQEVTMLRGRVAELEAGLHNASAELARKPAMPIDVSFRKAALGPAYVAVFKTTIKQDLPILVTVRSSALGVEKKFTLHVGHASTAELGHLQGVAIEPGDTVLVENNNFEPLEAPFSP